MKRGETVDHRPSKFWPLLHTALPIIGQNVDPSKPSAPMTKPIGTMRRMLRECGSDGSHMRRPSLNISISGKLGPARGPQRHYLGRYGHSALRTKTMPPSTPSKPTKNPAKALTTIKLASTGITVDIPIK
jgi:hypothetical protein